MASYSPEPAILGKPKELSRISIVAKATSVQTGASPISQIGSTEPMAMDAHLSAFRVEAVGAEHNQKQFVQYCGESKAGSASATDWIAEIKRIWAWGPASSLELARTVAAAKNPARHGQWQEIWKALPFSRRKADMLAAIGRRLVWVKWQTFANLPIGWSTLYELSKLPRAVFEEFLREGWIHPGLKLRDAKTLVAQLKGKQTGTRMRKANCREWLRRSAEFVRNNKRDWEPDERELVAGGLTRLAEEINAVETAIFNPSTFITQLGFLTDQPINL